MTSNDKRMETCGLCPICRRSGDCQYQKMVPQPIRQCEEFEAYESLPTKTVLKGTQLNAGVQARVEAKDSGKYKGLCSTCENRETCTFPRYEGGVWHCTEFK